MNMRSIRIALRTAHIGAASLLLGAVHFAPDPETWAPWVTAVLITGSLLVATEVLRHGLEYMRFLQGWTVVTKLALVGVGAAFPQALAPCLWTALILGSVISHAPGRIRQYAIWGDDGPCATRPCSTVSPPPRGDGQKGMPSSASGLAG